MGLLFLPPPPPPPKPAKLNEWMITHSGYRAEEIFKLSYGVPSGPSLAYEL
jgi:hypothetical protein